jgi:hypothetical protein
MLGIGLLTETSLAFGQAANPTLVAQVTGTVPPAGVLTSPPPAPVLVPPSGVLTTTERGVGTSTAQVRASGKPPTPKGAAVARARHHVLHWRSAARATPDASPVQSVRHTPSVVRTIPEQSRPDERGYELFLPWLGKGKE